MEKPTSTPPDQALLDRVIYAIFMDLLDSELFGDLVNKHCIIIAGASNPAIRAVVKAAFMAKVGI